MKSSNLFLSLLAIGLGLSSCSGKLSDLDRSGLNGDVKSIRNLQCEVTRDDGQWVAGENCARGYRLVEYSPEGFFQQMYVISDRNDTLNMVKARYEDGEKVEEVYSQGMLNAAGKPVLVPTTSILYEKASDQQINFEVWQEENLRFEGAVYFDSKGRTTRRVQVLDDRQVMVHSVYDKDLLVEKYQEELDGRRSGTQHYEYLDFDDHGNWITQIVYTEEDKIAPEMAITRVLTYYE